MNLNKKDFSTTDFYKLFFDFENEYRTFDIRTNRELPFWDIFRHDIFLELCYDKSSTTFRKISFYDKIKNQFKIIGRLFESLFRLFFFKCDDFFLSESREINKWGFQYDSYYEQVLSLLNKSIYYELNSPVLKYSQNRRRIFDIRFLFRKLQIFKTSISEIENQKLIKIIDDIEYFFDKKIDHAKYKKLYEDFLFDYNFFRFFLRFKNVKRVFVVQRGVQKALFLAAKDLNIPTFEFQHGDIVDGTLLYNYFSVEKIDRNSISFSEYLLTFSHVWTDNKNIPSKCVEIGNEVLSKTIGRSTNSKSISIISSPLHFNDLKNVAIEIAEKYRDYDILFKLHPMEFQFYDQYKSVFQDYKSIKLISDQFSINELMKICNQFVVIYSSVIYELVQNNKNVYIYKKLDFEKLDNKPNIPTVFLFDTINDFYLKNENEAQSHSNVDVPIFFQKFKKEEFLKVINNY